MSFSDRTVLITGATRGIGAALTEKLLHANANVVAVARDPAALDSLASAHPGRVHAIPTDLSDPQAVDGLIRALETRHPTLSVVVNNAALQVEMDFTSGDPLRHLQDLQRELAVNLSAAMTLSVGLLPVLARQPDAAVVNIGSALALAPKRAAPVYCATKAGLRSFTTALSYQCRANMPQVRIAHVVMALVDTDMTAGRGTGKISPETAATGILKGLEAGREEIWIGKAGLLRWIHRVSPGLAARILK
ncbi:SDR family oxidoreductase [Roseibium sp.]|uniref:SDR family oxidoreductase n=1 Tax=Roseibium sp. TaxID=1936156 RepID=UPI003A97F5BD